MREDGFTRYDCIRFSEAGDRFDPFSNATNNHVKNSYLGDNPWLGGATSAKKSHVMGASPYSPYN